MARGYLKEFETSKCLMLKEYFLKDLLLQADLPKISFDLFYEKKSYKSPLGVFYVSMSSILKNAEKKTFNSLIRRKPFNVLIRGRLSKE